MAAIAEYKYATDKGSVFKLRMDADTELGTSIRGAAPTGALTENMTLRISANSRVFGIQPRFALLGRQIGGNPNGSDDPGESSGCLVDNATRYKKVPVLTETHFNTLVSGSPEDIATTKVTIDGIDYWVAKLISEEVK